MEEFSLRVFDLIRSIPPGKVSTYGRIAAAAGSPRGARQVARLLHSSSSRQNLPWHRVVNASGKISLPGDSGVLQKKLLEHEGILFQNNEQIDLKRCLYKL